MKLPVYSLLIGIVSSALNLSAAQPSPQHEQNKAVPKAHLSTPASTQALAPLAKKPKAAVSTAATSPAAAPAAPAAPATPAATASSPSAPAGTPGLTLDEYIQALADAVPLSKDEQTDVKTYYLDDGTKMQGILNNASLSPLEQTRQVDALHDARLAKIAALLEDPARQKRFVDLEAAYRVALVELASSGGLVPTSPPPNVPEPTGVTPAQADKAHPAS